MYKPLNSGKPSTAQRQLFKERAFLGFFPLSEAAFMVGFVGTAHSLTNLLVGIFDTLIGMKQEMSHSVIVCAYYAILCIGYVFGCVGSSLFDRKLINIMSSLMFIDIVMTTSFDATNISKVTHFPSYSYMKLWIIYRAFVVMLNVYALLKVNKQVILMELLEEPNVLTPQILHSSKLESESGLEKA